MIRKWRGRLPKYDSWKILLLDRICPECGEVERWTLAERCPNPNPSYVNLKLCAAGMKVCRKANYFLSANTKSKINVRCRDLETLIANRNDLYAALLNWLETQSTTEDHNAK